MQPVHIKGEKYLLKGHINIDIGSSTLPEEISVDVMNSEGKAIHTAIGKPMAGEEEETTFSTYEYSLWGNIGDKMTLVPHDSRLICQTACTVIFCDFFPFTVPWCS